MSTIDMLVFVPLIPVLPLIVLWFLPWEGWIWKHIPKMILGPYALYCAFGAWYFKLPWWCVVIPAVLGIGITIFAVAKSRQSGELSSS